MWSYTWLKNTSLKKYKFNFQQLYFPVALERIFYMM